VLQRLRAFDPVWSVGLGAAAVALLWTIAHLADRGLWWDELWTVGLASPGTPTAESLEIIRSDVHPPLYYLGVGWWMTLLHSSSEWAARSFNFVALSAEIAAAFWAVRNRVAAPLAVWFALFFTSFGVLWYLQEARMYAFLICQSLLACVFVLVYERVSVRPLGWQFAVVAALIFTVLPFTHWFAGLFGGLILAGLFAWAVVERRTAYALLFFSIGTTLALLTLSWGWLNWQSTFGSLGVYGQARGLVLWEIRRSLVGTILFTFTLNPILVLAALLGAAFLVWEKPRRTAPLLILASAIVSVVLIFAVSLTTPMYETRNFTWFVAPGTLFAAIGLSRLADRLRLGPSAVAAGLAGLLALNLVTARAADWSYPLERDQWREAGKYLRAQPGCADAAIPAVMQWLPRRLAEFRSAVVQGQRIYGYYGGGPELFVPIYREDTVLPNRPATSCAVLLWIGQMTEEDARARGSQLLGTQFTGTRIARFGGQSLFVRDNAAGN
jgi:hypothetical protein